MAKPRQIDSNLNQDDQENPTGLPGGRPPLGGVVPPAPGPDEGPIEKSPIPGPGDGDLPLPGGDDDWQGKSRGGETPRERAAMLRPPVPTPMAGSSFLSEPGSGPTYGNFNPTA